MKIKNKRTLNFPAGLVLAVLFSIGCGGGTSSQYYLSTKTLYSPQQNSATYESPPSGFSVVFTQLVARHGSRGLGSLKYDLVVYNMWLAAEAEGALTDLGKKLGPDILKLMKAHFLLGYGVEGITKPGYGNITQVGIREHTELAARMHGRNASLFSQAGSGNVAASRSIINMSSGRDRVEDSESFFTKSLIASQPGLAALIVYPPAPYPYPEGAPVKQPDGTNRFLLYFPKLIPSLDLVTTVSDRFYSTYKDSQDYQAYQDGAELADKMTAIMTSPDAKRESRIVLERLFTSAFVDKVDSGVPGFANTGTYTFTSDDGKFTSTLTGNGKTKIKNVVNAAYMLHQVYSITPAMKNEADVDFTQYIPATQAKFLEQMKDTEEFYEKGPGMTEMGDVTWRMAQVLEDDFFNEVDAIAKGDFSHMAKLRFTHAEIIVPFATRLGIIDMSVQLPISEMFSYNNNPWRGKNVAPMAANIQWDVVRDDTGTLLVRMLYNEKETDFKAGCDGARHLAGSRYYEYAKLKACYGHTGIEK